VVNGIECSGLVFDTTCLRHFAIADRIDVLGDLVKGIPCRTTSVVVDELRRRMPEIPELQRVFDQSWISVEPIDATLERLGNFVTWAERIGSKGGHDLGEAGVLAVASELRFTAVIDERHARAVSAAHYTDVHGTLWLLAEAWRIDRATEVQVCSLVDALRESGMHLPCTGSGFPQFARLERLGPWK
jgi:predicted nucleic acid-binding protein